MAATHVCWQLSPAWPPPAGPRQSVSWTSLHPGGQSGRPPPAGSSAPGQTSAAGGRGAPCRAGGPACKAGRRAIWQQREGLSLAGTSRCRTGLTQCGTAIRGGCAWLTGQPSLIAEPHGALTGQFGSRMLSGPLPDLHQEPVPHRKATAVHASPPLKAADPEGHLQAPVDVLPVLEGQIHLIAGSVSTLIQPEDEIRAQM